MTGALDDLDWALEMYATFARGGDDERLLHLVVDGAPWSKSRPKFARNRGGIAYQPDDDRRAEARMRGHLQSVGAEPFLGNTMVACRFYRPDAQRVDVDNLLKHVCDSANGVLWEDDSQATLVFGEIMHDAERPRTVIVAGNHRSTLLRGDDRRRPCEHCDGLFLPSTKTARFCSQACSHAGRTTMLVEVACPQCGGAFRPKTKTQKLCSRECVSAQLTGMARSQGHPLSECETCGRRLTHYRGGRCRDCWRAAPGFYVAQVTA